MRLRRASVLFRVTAAWLPFTAPVSADEGMWLMNRPPLGALKERYGFEPTPAWMEHVQKSAARMGASGSFVSKRGLIMTNHHVGSDDIEKLSTPERNLLKTGFYAATPEQELRCPDMEIRVLMSIQDVTAEVQAAASADLSPADAGAARRERITRIEQDAEKSSGLECQMVTLYHGARYHLYSYKEYTDVRLVMAPEQSIAFYGGDNDNFEYPRHDFDVCFFRAYENGKPAEIEHYLKWSAAGAKEGELAIVVGHPGRTNRQYTLDHFKFMRDVDMPASLHRLWRREVELAGFMARSGENRRVASGDFFGTQNGRKARTGFQAAMNDPAVLAAKQESEASLREYVAADAQRAKDWGDAWDSIRDAYAGYRTYFNRHEAFESRIGGGSDLFSIARRIVRLAEEKVKPSGQRLPEYRESAMDSMMRAIHSPSPIYPALEANRLASGIGLALELVGGDEPLLAQVLGGKAPAARAAEIVAGCKLADGDVRKKLVEGGAEAVEASTDPMILFVRMIDSEARALRKAHQDGVESVERAAYAKIAAAQFARDGETRFPDATGTLRFSFGAISGYPQDGKTIAPFTTMAGLFECYKTRGTRTEYDLPKRWVDAQSKISMTTPMNFVCTADIIGGNSGSPVVNTAGEVIGLIFDGNIQSLAWNVAYDDAQARAVAVDSRAIIEGLRTVYAADALADELLGK